jgi:two-component system sensor histidine kinase/response regulator
MTANVMEDEIQKCLDCGMDDVVSKPVDPERLVGAILERIGPRAVSDVGVTGEKETESSEQIAEAPSHEKFSTFDYASVLKRCTGKHELVIRLTQKFSDRLAGELGALKSAANLSDANKVAEIAHRLKGAAGNLAAEALESAAATIEKKAKSGDVSEFERDFEQWDEVVREYQSEVEAASRSLHESSYC